MNKLRVAVASDLHADGSLADPRDTYVRTEPPQRQEFSNPLRDLFEFIDRRDLRADIVLCPGDMTNQSDSTGKSYSWAMLHELAAKLGATYVLASPGNHDVETHRPVAEPRAGLLGLKPSYPTSDTARDTQFWTDGFALIEQATWRILIINSCHDFPQHPGTFANEADEKAYFHALDRGSFSEQVQNKLEPILRALAYKPVNIVLTHHHVSEHEKRHLFKDTYGPMHRGDELLGVLDRSVHSGRWMVIHGHKHVPLLVNAAGNSALTPIVLSAASVGGKLWHPIVSVTRNQFHLLEFHLDQVPGLPDLRGLCRSFMWGFGDGWDVSSDSRSGLPSACGFGVAHDPRDLARRIREQISSQKTMLDWSNACEQIPELEYVGHRDLLHLDDFLAELDLEVVRDRRGRRRQIVAADDDI